VSRSLIVFLTDQLPNMNFTSRPIAPLLLLAFLIVVVGFVRAGLTPAIDEACILEWAINPVTNHELPPFLQPKPIPALLAKQLIITLGHGMNSWYMTKAVFALFAFLIVGGTYVWRKESGDDSYQASVVALIVATTPWILNGAGKVLSELPALAFCVWGFAAVARAENSFQKAGFKDIETWIASFGAVFLFLLGVASRSTAFTIAGAFLGYRFLELLLNIKRSNDSPKYSSLFVPVGIGCLLALVIAAWPLRFNLPKMPWHLVEVSVSDFQRSPKSTVAAFFFGGGAWSLVAGVFVVFAVCFRKFQRQDLAVIAWFVAAASPYLVITMMRGEVLPRHAADLTLPLALLVFRMGSRVSEIKEVPNYFALIQTIVFCMVLLIGWFIAHRLGSEWSTWFTHRALDGRGFIYWLIVPFIGFVGIYVLLRFKNLGNWTLAFFAFFGLCHIYIALDGIRTDAMKLSPMMLRSTMQNMNIDQENKSVIIPGVTYESDMILYSLPDWPINTVQFQNPAKEIESQSDMPPGWVFIAHHHLIDNPNLIQQLENEFGNGAQLEEHSTQAFVTLYEVQSSSE